MASTTLSLGFLFRAGEAEQNDNEHFKVFGRKKETAFSTLSNVQDTTLYHPNSTVLMVPPNTQDHFTSAPAANTHTTK